MAKRYDELKKRSEALIRLDDNLYRVMFDGKTVDGKIEYHYRAKRYINLSIKCAGQNINKPRLFGRDNLLYLEVYDLDYIFARDYLEENVSAAFIKHGIRHCSTVVAALNRQRAKIYIDITFRYAYLNYIWGTLGSYEEQCKYSSLIRQYDFIRYNIYQNLLEINDKELNKFLIIPLAGIEPFDLGSPSKILD